MEYRRYGKFNYKDYYSTWFAIAFLFLIVVTNLYDGTYSYLTAWPILLIMLMALGIAIPNKEKFTISDEVIEVKRGGKIYKIVMPQEMTLVISYADIYPIWAKRIGLGNSMYILKKKYSVSILRKISTDKLLNTLHTKYVYRYSNCLIEKLFKSDFIYSFVYEQSLLERIMSEKKITLILPETLADKININKLACEIYIDKGF